MYPEISTLSALDITNDLDFLVQHRRIIGTPAPGVYEVQHHPQHQIHQQQHYGSQQQQQLYNSHQQPVPQRNGPVMGIGMGGGMGRTVNNVGMDMSNGVLPPQVQAQQQQASQMGPPPPNNPMMHPHPHPHPHPLQPLIQQQHPVGVAVGVGYEHQYVGDMPSFGPSGVGGRMREPQPMSMNSYQQQQHGLPPLGHLPPPPSQPPTTKSRDASYLAYSGGPGPGGRMHPSSHGPPLPLPGNSAHNHGHGYGKDHEKPQGPAGPGPGPSNNGPGGHHHTYFGQGGSNVGVDGGSAYGPTSSSSHVPGNGMNGRRSILPVHVMSNGSSGGGGGKPNGTWMGGYHHGNGGGKGGEWGDARMIHEDEMLVREREREREREKDRDREMDRERRYRDRDLQEFDRERHRDHQHIQQHRQPPLYGGNSAPPPQGPGVVHHVAPSHHHHRPPPHHHHVVHHHHHSSTSLPPGGVGSAPIVHSPRSSRDYDSRPPPQLHPGPGQPHSEVIMLSSGNKSSAQPQPHPREREREPWSGKGPDEPHHNPPTSVHEYRERERERERDHLIREMDNRNMHSRRPSSGPPMLPLEERDRPMPMSFVMAPSHNVQPTPTPNSHLSSSAPGTSPRGAPPSWPTPSSYDDTHRMPSSSTPGYSPRAHDAVRSPIQAHRYAPSSTSSGMGRHIATGSSSSSSGLHHMISTPPPNRVRPPPSPSYSNPVSKSHRSPGAR